MHHDSNDIAIIGMAGRFPGARNIDEFWRNLRDGVESITHRSDQEIAAAGVPAELRNHPDYVRAAATLDEIELFDAAFFGFTPKEAEILDPQQRLLLECAWEALEHAGYEPEGFPGRIGIYAGAAMSSYLGNLSRNPDICRASSFFQLMLSNDKDHLATRIAYKLNLRGPAIGVQSACSTSLVAVHLACESLLSRQCDLALAGGVMIRVSPFGSQEPGYLYQEGGITSRDGHCRAFDARAQGTVFGNGLGLVALKRLSDALAAGDHVHALIKGSAVNNDGAARVGYTAPSVEGQASVIAEALAVAGVQPETIGYVEAHGTGTPLGDPIEVLALKKAFAARTSQQHCCALGSVKTNVGHLETASGIAGLIKAVLALKHRQIPPHLHFEIANANIDFAHGPFYVSARLVDWPAASQPRRAGVSSFGMGGTNAHVVLEEAPQAPQSTGRPAPWCLLQLSARTPEALENATDRLAQALAAPLSGTLGDVAHTLSAGRRCFAHRRFAVCRDLQDASALLASCDPARLLTGVPDDTAPQIAFLFPGQGAQYVSMCQELYQIESVFRDQVDYGARLLKSYIACDLREILFPAESARENAAQQLSQTAFTQPALFIIEYALARLLASWGIAPKVSVGHSIGEFVAATLAGVFTLGEALSLVATRGRLLQDLPPGGMLAVALTEAELLPLLPHQLTIAAVNGPVSCTVAGPLTALSRFESLLKDRGVLFRRLETSHAFHSPMVDPVVNRFIQRVANVARKPPATRWISNVTGDWITTAEATDPAYWGRHLRQPVRFGAALQLLASNPNTILLEVGPGRTLSNLARKQVSGMRVISTVPSAQELEPAFPALLTAVGKLWLAGVQVRLNENGRRVPLPTYPFERQRYWVMPAEADGKKLDPQASHHAAPAEPILAQPAAASLTDLERAVIAIWREVIGVEDIRPHHNFFDLGGDSLLATQVMTRLREQLGAQIPLDTIFSEPTVGAMAEKIASLRSPSDAVVANLRPFPREGPLPLSFAQQRLFVLDELAPANPFYNVPIAVHIEGPLDSIALARSLEAIVARHEVLRTTFSVVDGNPTQHIHAALPPEFAMLNLESHPHSERQSHALHLLSQEARRVFDLKRGPMLRTHLLRLAPESHYLLVTMHHICCDAWSVGVLMRELVEFYGAYSSGACAPLPPLAVQYVDFALWQREHLQGEVLRRNLEYWIHRLAALPKLVLKRARPLPAEPSFSGDQQQIQLAGPLSAGLRNMSRSDEATLFMVLLAVFKIVLRFHSGQDDIVVGTDIANRQHRATEDLIGFFVNQLVLRTDLSGNPTFRQVVRRVRDTMLGAYAHQNLPFDKLVEVLNPARDARGTPLFQVKFVLQNAPTPHLALSNLKLTPLEIEQGTAKFDLLFNLNETPQGIQGVLEYSTEVFEAAAVGELLQDFETLAQFVVEQPESTLDQLNRALEQVRHQQRALTRDLRRERLLSTRRTAEKLPAASGAR